MPRFVWLLAWYEGSFEDQEYGDIAVLEDPTQEQVAGILSDYVDKHNASYGRHFQCVLYFSSFNRDKTPDTFASMVGSGVYCKFVLERLPFL